jgi:serine/threonine protein kinase
MKILNLACLLMISGFCEPKFLNRMGRAKNVKVGDILQGEKTEYTIIEKIGKGAYTKVFKAVNSVNEFVSIKAMEFEDIEDLEKHETEAIVLKQLSFLNKNCYPETYEYFIHEKFLIKNKFLIIVMELCDGSLEERLANKGPFYPAVYLNIFFIFLNFYLVPKNTCVI